MKSDKSQPVGVLDALTAGLALAGRRPWLLLFPILLDLFVWLAPRLSVAGLLRRLLAAWEGLLRTAYTAEQLAQMEEMLRAVRSLLTQAGAEINLTEMLAGHWLSPPSAVAVAQSPRLALISDAVLAPAGLGIDLQAVAVAPWQHTLTVDGIGATLLVVLGLWLLGQVLAALYLYWMARDWRSGQTVVQQSARPAGALGAAGPFEAGSIGNIGRVVIRLVAFNIALGLLGFVLRVPLGISLSLMMFAGGSLASILFILTGSLTLWLLLWFLAACFFVSEAVVLDGLPLGRAIGQSFNLVRFGGLRAFGLIALLNLLVLGFRALWGIVGSTPAGALVAIVGNAYLVTGALLAVFFFYEDLRTRRQGAGK